MLSYDFQNFLYFVRTKQFYKMPIKSYLAHPHEGKKNELIEAISALKQCEVIPAENHDVLVIVTETEDREEEDQLKENLETIPSLKMLAMVSGFHTPKPN